MDLSTKRKQESNMVMMAKTQKMDSNHHHTCTYSSPPPAASNWSQLPDNLLLSILELLSPCPNLLVIAAVCTQWRSLVKSFPPFLLCRQPCFPCLKTITKDSVFSQPIVSKDILANDLCIGRSHGHLIFGPDNSRTLLVTSIFSTNVIRPPQLLSTYYTTENFAILTAPPSSPSCMLLVGFKATGTMSEIRAWHLGANAYGWSVINPHLQDCIESVLNFKGQVFCLLRNHSLLVIETEPPLRSWEEVGVQFSNFDRHVRICSQYLAECDGKLLLVLFIEDSRLLIIKVYRMDFKNRAWVEFQNIGDWCLFKDGIGRGLLACHNPKRWGGRSNCIYVAKRGVDTWIELPLNRYSIYPSSLTTSYHWPPPVWVYPSLLF